VYEWIKPFELYWRKRIQALNDLLNEETP
jgi:hypothetical protein